MLIISEDNPILTDGYFRVNKIAIVGIIINNIIQYPRNTTSYKLP